jgi:hypothetical protein
VLVAQLEHLHRQGQLNLQKLFFYVQPSLQVWPKGIYVVGMSVSPLGFLVALVVHCCLPACLCPSVLRRRHALRRETLDVARWRGVSCTPSWLRSSSVRRSVMIKRHASDHARTLPPARPPAHTHALGPRQRQMLRQMMIR